jgi:putative transposase
MYVARRIRLRPSRPQRIALAKAAGCARWAWNWGLRKKIEAYETTGNSPSAVDLHRELNRLKDVAVEEGGVPWMRESSKCAPQEALRDLDAAFGHFFRRVRAGGPPGFPRFKAKRPGEGHFRLTGTIRVEGTHLRIPVIGRIRIAPGDRDYAPGGAYGSVSLVQEHGEWFASVRIELPDPEPVSVDTAPTAALDLGVRKLAVVATTDGRLEVVPNRRALLRAKRRLRAAHKRVSRRRKGSGRRRRAVRTLGRVHRRVRNVRRDATHQLTSRIARDHAVVAVEDLSVRAMTASAQGPGRSAKAGLNRSLLDASFGEVLRQLDYKLALRGGRLVRTDPAYTSQRCSSCGSFTDCGSCETFTCAACGAVLDRDANAARNLLVPRGGALSRGEVVAASWTETRNARGEAVRRHSLRAGALASMKREQEAFDHG